MNVNKVLVTGSKGFVGKHLCNRLSKNGLSVVSGDKNDDNKFNVTDMDHLQFIEDVEAIIHLAAKSNVVYSYNNTYNTYHTNVLGTLNILEFARMRNIRKLIFVSTYVYGEPKYLPVDEKHPINPHSPYHNSKLLAEHICENYSHHFGIDVVTLRPFYLYGPNFRSDSFISSVIRQIKENGKVLLSGDRTQRDFLFIDDFINLLAIILNKFPRGYNVFNVGSGTSHTLKEVAEIIAKLMNKKIIINYDKESRPNDTIYMKADISKVSNSFNWKPLVDINKGLKLTI